MLAQLIVRPVHDENQNQTILVLGEKCNLKIDKYLLTIIFGDKNPALAVLVLLTKNWCNPG